MKVRKTFKEHGGVNKIEINKREVLVYTSIFLYCVAYFLSRIRIPFSQAIIYKTMFLAAFVAVLNVFFDSSFARKQILFTAFFGIFLLLDAFSAGNYEILTLFLIIWGCRNANYEKVIRLIIGIVTVMTISTMCAVLFGLMESNMHIIGGRLRYDFGYGSWAILPFQYLSLVMMFLYVKRKKTHLCDVVIFLAIGFLICAWTATKSALLLLVIGIMGLHTCEYIKIRKWKRLKFLMLIPELLALFSYIITRYYATIESYVMQKINTLLNNRLMYSAIGLEKYGISLFGNSDYKTVYESKGYFGIDNSYLYLLVAWGVIGLGVVLFIYSYIIYYCVKTENLKLLFITLIMIINAFMWNRLLILIEMEMLIYFADIFKFERCKEVRGYVRKTA